MSPAAYCRLQAENQQRQEEVFICANQGVTWWTSRETARRYQRTYQRLDIQPKFYILLHLLPRPCRRKICNIMVFSRLLLPAPAASSLQTQLSISRVCFEAGLLFAASHPTLVPVPPSSLALHLELPAHSNIAEKLLLAVPWRHEDQKPGLVLAKLHTINAVPSHASTHLAKFKMQVLSGDHIL